MGRPESSILRDSLSSRPNSTAMEFWLFLRARGPRMVSSLRSGLHRRAFLKVACVGSGALLGGCFARRLPPKAPGHEDALAVARRAAAFVRANAVVQSDGIAWRKSPDEPILVDDLYHGSAGVILFMLEL